VFTGSILRYCGTLEAVLRDLTILEDRNLGDDVLCNHFATHRAEVVCAVFLPPPVQARPDLVLQVEALHLPVGVRRFGNGLDSKLMPVRH
jgi:hypothetical protein